MQPNRNRKKVFKSLIHIILITFVLFGITTCKRDDNSGKDDLGFTIDLNVIIHHWDGVFNWTQTRVGAVPDMGKNGNPRIIMTMQKWFVKHSDYYSGLYTIYSDDMGKTWSTPKEEKALSWRHKKNDIIEGICDFTPGWHQATKKLIAIGHTVYYIKGGKLMPNRPRSTAYAVYDPETEQWSPWKKLKMPDENKFYNAGAGCAQWLVKSDGTLLIPIYFIAKNDTTRCNSVTVLHCSFDGENLSYIEHGEELKLNIPRGLDEPSLTFFKGKYFLTIRNDIKAYITVSDDAMHWQPIKPWTFDDGLELGSYNTQQHWAAHSDGLFLVYTRRGANNDHIPRSRAPLFIARIDPEKLVVIKNTEKILIPQRGVMMGNFGVSIINKKETWVTVGENMYPPENLNMGADGSVFAAKILWSKPNELFNAIYGSGLKK